MLSQDWWNGLFAAIDGKDTPQFLSYLSQDAEFRFGNGPSALGTKTWARPCQASSARFQPASTSGCTTWEGPDSAVAEGTVTYTRLDGSTITLPFVDVFHFRGDRIGRY